MTALALKASRPRFPSIKHAILYYWAAVALTAIPVPGKAAVAARAAVPASGNRPAVPAVIAQPAVPAVAGAPTLLPFFTFVKNSTETILGFRLPLGGASALIAALGTRTMIREIDQIASAVVTPPIWDMGTGVYGISDEPIWCITNELMLGWLASQHDATTITLIMASQALDFKVILSNDDLGAVSVLLGE